MANTIQTYLNLVTSAHNQQPKFLATVSLSVEAQVRFQDVLGAMIALFDLDLPPTGDQLDIIGKWVGVSRSVTIPAALVSFTWDSADLNLKWDAGVWLPSGYSNIISLPDEFYLLLIRAKILANSVFAPYLILISDHQNMSYDLVIMNFATAIVPTFILAIFTEQKIPLKPEGVKLNGIFTSLVAGPAFFWDQNTTQAKGWDVGSWLDQIG